MENQNLIYKVINDKFRHNGSNDSRAYMNDDDLFQWGSIGLLKAIRTYDPDREIPFAIWAYIRIKYAIMYYTNPNSFLKENRQRMMNDNNTHFSDYVDHLRYNESYSDYECFAIIAGKENMNRVSYTDNSLWKVQISELMDHLEEPEKNIVNYLSQGYSQAEIAKKMNVTRQRINERMKTIRRKYELYVG